MHEFSELFFDFCNCNWHKLYVLTFSVHDAFGNKYNFLFSKPFYLIESEITFHYKHFVLAIKVENHKLGILFLLDFPTSLKKLTSLSPYTLRSKKDLPTLILKGTNRIKFTQKAIRFIIFQIEKICMTSRIAKREVSTFVSNRRVRLVTPGFKVF